MACLVTAQLLYSHQRNERQSVLKALQTLRATLGWEPVEVKTRDRCFEQSTSPETETLLLSGTQPGCLEPFGGEMFYEL